MTPNIPEQNETKNDIEELPSPSQTQIGELKDTSTYDAVFGEITEDGPNYRNVCIPLQRPSTGLVCHTS